MAAFRDAREELATLSIGLFTASTDGRAGAEQMHTHLAAAGSVDFPIGYGLERLDIAARYGAFTEARRGIVHATGFLLRGETGDGEPPRIAVSVYSTGAVGRLQPDEVLGLVRHWERTTR